MVRENGFPLNLFCVLSLQREETMKDICMFMTIKSSIKVALYFLKICKILRSEETG